MEEKKELVIGESSGLEVEDQRTAKERYWENIVKAHKRSRLTQKKFCELNGLKQKTLSRWKSYFQKGKSKSLKQKVLIKSEGAPKQEESLNFLSVELLDPMKLKEPEVKADKLVFYHRSGFKVELEERSNLELFKLGITILMELSGC